MRKVSEFPECDTKDPVARMRVYQLAFKLRPACLEDAQIIQQNPITQKTAGQLYTAVGSIAANLVEGTHEALVGIVPVFLNTRLVRREKASSGMRARNTSLSLKSSLTG